MASRRPNGRRRGAAHATSAHVRPAHAPAHTHSRHDKLRASPSPALRRHIAATPDCNACATSQRPRCITAGGAPPHTCARRPPHLMGFGEATPAPAERPHRHERQDTLRASPEPAMSKNIPATHDWNACATSTRLGGRHAGAATRRGELRGLLWPNRLRPPHGLRRPYGLGGLHGRRACTPSMGSFLGSDGRWVQAGQKDAGDPGSMGSEVHGLRVGSSWAPANQEAPAAQWAAATPLASNDPMRCGSACSSDGGGLRAGGRALGPPPPAQGWGRAMSGARAGVRDCARPTGRHCSVAARSSSTDLAEGRAARGLWRALRPRIWQRQRSWTSSGSTPSPGSAGPRRRSGHWRSR